MDHALRPYATAGIALVGASMIAVAPLTTPLPDSALTRDVELTADPVASFQDVFQEAAANIQALNGAFQDANDALTDALQNGPGDVSPQELIDAVTFLGGDQKTFIDPLTAWTLSVQTPGSIGDPGFSESHAFLFGLLSNQAHDLLPDLFPAVPDYLPPIANFLASPLSGVLLGAVSPMIAPWVALNNSIADISENLFGENPDFDAALQDLFNTPVNMLDGLLNGATLNLDDLAPLINDAGVLPEGASVDGLSFAFGGLLTPGSVGAPTSTDGLTLPAVAGGGSILNALGLDLSVTSPLTITFPWIGEGVGPLGALAGLEQVIAEVLSGVLVHDSPDPTAALDPGLVPDFSQALGDLFGAL
ncbi:outer membrane porin GjpA [Mycobacterium shimoidei]|jgi:hypothetical protein|uniref:PE-PGRS family protein n=1 Tax=Mycobacterium shimoidei TaxID=29313 RepID=A0A1E3TII9_MYCSH|nr:outer membrane porin GjpA [Mycobacterium shimoidei]MCV7257800.1 outer membrane porin GjpA [Mycobacterium shimoidei]ODR14237.1 hypothetical protein BHQ16_07395 [Mycobacterium shimoidei]ORW83866.1 hypothetical protein AWC26_00075 [Mycobacterium shimoidei]SRX91943.1 hypothetical protein MSP7336_00164 [Mycobacterium shimoidei]